MKPKSKTLYKKSSTYKKYQKAFKTHMLVYSQKKIWVSKIGKNLGT